MNLGLLIPEATTIFWIWFPILLVVVFILPSKYIKFKNKDYILGAGNIFIVFSYSIIVSLYIVFYSSAGYIINFDFFVSLFILGYFIYLINLFKKYLTKKFIYGFILAPFIISFSVFFYLYNGEKIYKLSRFCEITKITNIIYCKYSNGIYLGEMKAFYRQGKGVYKWNSGKIYEGEWKNSLMDGEGIMTENGNVTKGTWKKHKFIK